MIPKNDEYALISRSSNPNDRDSFEHHDEIKAIHSTKIVDPEIVKYYPGKAGPRR